MAEGGPSGVFCAWKQETAGTEALAPWLCIVHSAG